MARAEAGVIWRDVALPAADAGLYPLAGSSPDVGVVGYSLGGGIGYLGRKHGIATNSVTAIELVTAEGEYIRATADDHPDLFWAMRGGGGNFGAVTAMEFRLYPVEELYAGALIWPWEHGERVITRWRDWTETLPDEVTSMARLLQLPDMETVPEPIRGRQIVIVTAAVLGDQATGVEIMRPLRDLGPELDFMAPMPPHGLSVLHGDPEDPVPVSSNTSILDSLPDAAIDAFIAHAGPGSNSQLLMAEFRHMGGAFGRSAPHHGALDRIDGEYIAFTGGMAIDPEADAIVEEQSDALIDALAPYSSGRHYLNFAERNVDTSTAYSAHAWERLRRIRAEADPTGVFHANHEI
jgi:FAD/FMN-containing dehydrogenase